MGLGTLAFRIGRTIGKHPAAGRIFCLTERFLPLQRIQRSEKLVAFHHPRPIASRHILIVPTRPFPAIVNTRHSAESTRELVVAMVAMARSIANQIDQESYWKLIINGGARQDIGQMHAHLVLDDSVVHPQGLLLHDPETWPVIYKELRVADDIENNGYSLIIREIAGNRPRAHVASTTVNV